MFKYLLVPLDGTRFAEHILPEAFQIARGMDVPIVLLHSVDASSISAEELDQRPMPIITHDSAGTYGYSSGTHGPDDERLPRGIEGSDWVSMPGMHGSLDIQLPDQEQERATTLDRIIESKSDLAERYMLPIARALQEKGIVVERAIEMEPAHAAIIRYTKGRDGGLIAMTTHSRTGLDRWRMGSVADKVLQECSVPLLLFHPREGSEAPSTINNILVPLDGSSVSQSALPVAEALAGRLNVPVHLTKVVPTGKEVYIGSGTSPSYGSAPLEEADDEHLRYLDRVKQGLTQKGITADLKLMTGSASDKIVEYALEDTLIVMATLGESSMMNRILGSTADKVLRSARGPVLFVKPDGYPRTKNLY